MKLMTEIKDGVIKYYNLKSFRQEQFLKKLEDRLGEKCYINTDDGVLFVRGTLNGKKVDSHYQLGDTDSMPHYIIKAADEANYKFL